jgi:hypothetical protein
MQRRSNACAAPAQLPLNLQRDPKDRPFAQDPVGLLQALADLLLGALGEKVEETATVEESKDEPEDHA